MKKIFLRCKFLLSQYYKDCIVFSFVISFSWVLVYRIISPPITILMMETIVTENGKWKYEYVDRSKISPYLKVCAMASEDQNFPFHSGMDIEAIKKAVAVNKKGKKVFGASTISQQVAKNVFLFPQRSYIRKGLEVYFTVLIETLWPKDKILEMYLNVAEMGNNIFGAEVAAENYFGKNAANLSVRESAAIISILPSPRKYSVLKPGSYVSGRQSEIVNLYYSLDGINYLRELYIKTDTPLYDFRNYKK